jgi:hypothetical protein
MEEQLLIQGREKNMEPVEQNPNEESAITNIITDFYHEECIRADPL